MVTTEMSFNEKFDVFDPKNVFFRYFRQKSTVFKALVDYYRGPTIFLKNIFLVHHDHMKPETQK